MNVIGPRILVPVPIGTSMYLWPVCTYPGTYWPGIVSWYCTVSRYCIPVRTGPVLASGIGPHR